VIDCHKGRLLTTSSCPQFILPKTGLLLISVEILLLSQVPLEFRLVALADVWGPGVVTIQTDFPTKIWSILIDPSACCSMISSNVLFSSICQIDVGATGRQVRICSIHLSLQNSKILILLSGGRETERTNNFSIVENQRPCFQKVLAHNGPSPYDPRESE
jgi:hypothetical protein